MYIVHEHFLRLGKSEYFVYCEINKNTHTCATIKAFSKNTNFSISKMKYLIQATY